MSNDFMRRMMREQGYEPSESTVERESEVEAPEPVEAPTDALRAIKEAIAARQAAPVPTVVETAPPVRSSGSIFEDEIKSVVAWAQRDPANASRLIGLIGRDYMINMIAERRAEVADPMPDLSRITAGQCSLFDNWGKATKPDKNKKEKGASAPRYQASIELWDTDVGTDISSKINSVFLATAPLLNKEELTKKIDGLRKADGRPWRKRHEHDDEGEALASFGDRLLTLHDQNPGWLFGPLFTRKGNATSGKGTKYFLGHYAAIEEASIGTPNAELIVLREDHGELIFSRFASTYSNGSPLAGKVIGHSRISNRVDLTMWRTAPIR